MNELTQKKIRFSDAAIAVGVNQKTLRNWLQRNKINLISDHSGPSWTEFTYGDICVLALMREMVRWGVQVNEANEIALAVIAQKAGPLLYYKNTLKKALLASLKIYALIVFADADGEIRHALVPFSDFDGFPSGFPSFLALDPGRIIQDAFAAPSGEKRQSTSEPSE